AGGAAAITADFGVPLLGQLPLDSRIREQTDSGTPTVVAEPDSAITRAYREAAWLLGAAQAEQREDHGAKFGKIVVEKGQ
ncbi:MAG: Mrp/NBP35 family ATP-binding protein, partial [Gammaproteobacteria bacterium]|nr:Mrp/NBP35 family ATP-binding protein [Gammaproteobacteria bacterium]